MIEIEVSGARIRVEPGVDPTTLSTVLSALRGGGDRARGRPQGGDGGHTRSIFASRCTRCRRWWSEALRANPYCGDVFVFRSKRADRVKLLAWDGSGMMLGDEVAASGQLHLAAGSATAWCI